MSTERLIGVILGSVREGRAGQAVAEWVLNATTDRAAHYELIDLAEHQLPHFSEPFPPMMGNHSDPDTLQWAATIASFHGFVIITPEYNHGVPGVLKNALDSLYDEWAGKPVGLIGYGLVGGARALDQLRLLTVILGMRPVPTQVELPITTVRTGISNESQYHSTLAQLFSELENSL